MRCSHYIFTIKQKLKKSEKLKFLEKEYFYYNFWRQINYRLKAVRTPHTYLDQFIYM